MAAWKGICPSPNKLMDNRKMQSSLNEDCSGTVFPCLCSSSHMPLTDGPTWPPGTTRGHHCEEMALQSAGAHSSSVCFLYCLPVASLSLFSFAFHTQAIKSVSQCCDPLQHSLYLFLLFSCSLGFLPLSLFLAGLFLGWGGRGWGRNREKEKWGRGVTFAALWLTTCVSGSLYLHVSHGKEGGGRGWREKKDRHMVLVCWVKFRVGLFVSCDEQREIRPHNHLQIWLLPRQW